MTAGEFCPNGHDMRGAPIPQGYREWYGDLTHYSRSIGVEIRGVYDGVLYWQCPDCAIAWPRFVGDRLGDASRTYVEQHNAKSVTS